MAISGVNSLPAGIKAGGGVTEQSSKERKRDREREKEEVEGGGYTKEQNRGGGASDPR